MAGRIKRISSATAALYYMRAVALIGGGVFFLSLARLDLARLNYSFLLLLALTIAAGSRINIRIPRFKSNVSVSETFVFVTLFLFGAEAAILVASLESYCSSFSITKKQLTRLFNSANMAISIFLASTALRLAFGGEEAVLASELTWFTIAICLMATVQFLHNSSTIAIAAALRSGQRVWETWTRYYLWTAISYFTAAFAAAAIAKLYTIFGAKSLIIAAPILTIVYFTYLTYLKNLEASMTQAEQASRHLAELQVSEERFRSAFDHAPIGMALIAPDGHWLQVNQSLCNIVGYTEEELLQIGFANLTEPEDVAAFSAKFDEVLTGRVLSAQIEIRYIHKSGKEVWALVSISLIRVTKEQSAQLILQIQPIGDRKRAEDKLRHEAMHDTLTGLPNRASIMLAIRDALERQKEAPDTLFAVLFIDLDRFKIINDSLGHMAGDQLLIGIARRLSNSVRPTDTVARLGGDEFTILLRGVRSPADVVRVAERIQHLVSQPFSLNGFETFTTASIGIAFSSGDYDEAEEILRDADTAMYRAKAAGKAQHTVFDKGMHAQAMSVLKIESDLRRALNRREFLLHYQPIISLETGRITGFEALVRWLHPERGLIPPGEFIPVAEETGLIVPIGQWVLKEACRQVREWEIRDATCAGLSINVNLSSKQFGHAHLIDQIVETLETTGLDPRRLKLEITESVVMENIEMATGMLEQLRSLGVELSIDDFGTGYSSLSYLHRLPIDTLKIDRSFISHMGDNNENREIVRTIITLAKTLNLGVVAEGVETEAQVALLKALGCDSAQGYLFSKPVDATNASLLIETERQFTADLFSGADVLGKSAGQVLNSTYKM